MDRPLSIVLVEDVAAEAELTVRALKRAGLDCTTERVETEAAFRASLGRGPDLILSDFTLPRFDGMSALRIAQEIAPEVPFLFVSGTIGEERAINALKHGATDYVLKSNLARLGPAVVRALQEAQDRRAARRAEQRFRDLVQTSQDWIWELDVDGRYTFCSPGVRDILGIGADEMLGSHHLAHLHQDDHVVVEGALRSLGAQERRLSSLTARWRHQDGSYRWLERQALALVDGHGLITGFRGTDRDVTVRKLQEEKIQRLNRIHRMLSSINSAVLRIRNRQDLLREVCRIAARQGGYPHAGVLLMEPGTTTIRPMVIEGDHAAFLRPFSLSVRSNVTQFSSLTEQAVSTGTPAACNDLADATQTLYFSEPALEWGYRACAALPLLVDGTAIGTLNLYAREVGAFTEEELGVLGQVAGSLSFALQYLEKEGAAEFLAYFDPMTGLARRGLFCERLARILADSVPATSNDLAVLVLDVERLGAINDQYGRHGGDRLLQLAAERLKAAIPDPTHLAYFGNGCFAVVTIGSAARGVPAERSQAQVIRLFDQGFIVDGRDLQAAVRVGVARFPSDGRLADDLLQNAELAVKNAKESGEKFLDYAPDMNVSLRRRVTLEQQLRRALERQQFLLYYQPKISLESGRIDGVEALLRWNDPDVGVRSPADFIPVLEESGLIVNVGNWVIGQAVADALAWHAQGLPAVPIAVNVSTRQLKPRDFVDSVLRAIAPLSALGLRLDIEITESALMADADAGTEKLTQLKAAGVGIAIDDFGTGYSSLARLARLAVDSLKIDRSFITRLESVPANRAIVSTIIALARSLHLIVVAEGVETEQELQVLRGLRCHQFQGYLAAKPMPAHDFQAFMLEPHATFHAAHRA
jgi:PAS domain S-box-containing protein/diguanylate cyclase (GGDEF)-like protein